MGGRLDLTFLQPLSFTLSWKGLSFLGSLPSKDGVAVCYRFPSLVWSVSQRAPIPAHWLYGELLLPLIHVRCRRQPGRNLDCRETSTWDLCTQLLPLICSIQPPELLMVWVWEVSAP